MQLSIFGVSASRIAHCPTAVAATNSITFDIWFYQDGAISPVPCGPQISVGFNDTVNNNSCSTWRIATADAVTMSVRQTIPPSLQTNGEQTCTVYWVWSNNGVVSPSCADTVLVTTAELSAYVCYQPPNTRVFGLNIVCEPN
ncbi:uncharacterized protein TrAFT101_002032 [Trichoderma asperellum]|uniref:uncharacterized protein n=1 Tax=Trichoderma asperellum TaxID=101201 RepID=UPI00331FF130|nr:hypothetical protein TrAFT101_002032 [Trichoderma asperellum]